MNIGFWINELDCKDITFNLFNYALCNQNILGNNSFIFYNKNSKNNNDLLKEKFNNHFLVFGLDNFIQIDEILDSLNITHLCIIKYGKNDNLISKVAKNIIQSFYDCSEPHGDIYTSLSPYISNYTSNIKILPYIINLPSNKDNLKNKLNIPKKCKVFGYYGEKISFNIQFVHKVIYEVAKTNKNIYFIFSNINKFCPTLPNIIHLPLIIDSNEKVKFINTCEAMIWGKSEGESFGISIGEFSTLNKPIIAMNVGIHRGHFEILKHKGIWYKNELDLFTILTNFDLLLKKKKLIDWNGYRKYEPEKVMKIFRECLSI